MMQPADALDHLDARLALSDTLEVEAIDYETNSLLVTDTYGAHFRVTVTEVDE
jgi:hypothetical protein